MYSFAGITLDQKVFLISNNFNDKRNAIVKEMVCFGNVCLRSIVSFIRWLPVVFITALICWAYFAYVVQLCFFTVDNNFERAIYLFVFHLLLFMFLWSYYETIFRPVGRPPKMFYVDSQTRQDLYSSEESECREILEYYVKQHQIPVNNRNNDGSVRYCYKCNCIKPDRCHHCSVCGHCVLKFDHHCPWVNTCINYFNYKFFLQFLFYGLILCLWGILTDLQYFIAFWKNALRLSAGFGRFHIVFLFFVAGMFAASITCLFSYHIYLTARNQSTIESFRPPVFIYGIDKNGFNLGIRRNFRQVFGDICLFWFLPIFSSHGSGVTFDQKGFRTERKRLLHLDSNDDDDLEELE
ncbi:Palmitoyltransferase ZDHHC2 [Dirofilaria immitis]